MRCLYVIRFPIIIIRFPIDMHTTNDTTMQNHRTTTFSTSVKYGKQNNKGCLCERRAAKKKEHGTNCEKQLKENFGHSETLYACNTYQFTDYSRYAMTVFKEEDKRQHRDAHWQTDLQNAYELGKRLVEKAKGE